jgi:hypothetical protein
MATKTKEKAAPKKYSLSNAISWITGRKTKEKNEKYSDFSIEPCDGLNETYLFDFKNYSSQYNGSGSFFIGGFNGDIDSGGVVTVGDQENAIETNPDGTHRMRQQYNVKVPSKKIKVKPKDVLHELETVPTPFSLMGLDDKIEILKDKEKLIVQHYAKREVSALIERLENRKKYVEHKAFFDSFANTTDEKIDVLLGKYQLVMKTSDIFIPEFPDEAVKVMKDYTEKLKEVCNKKPIFYVIAEESLFKKSYEKRDPILLVQSPFGFYWQILGAWDEELILLSEL